MAAARGSESSKDAQRGRPSKLPLLNQGNPMLFPGTDVPAENPQERVRGASQEAITASSTLMANLCPVPMLVPHRPDADSEEQVLPVGLLLHVVRTWHDQPNLFREEPISPIVQRQPHTFKSSQAGLGIWGIRKSLPTGTPWCRDARSIYARVLALRREALL